MKIIQVHSKLNIYLILFVLLLVIVLPSSTAKISCSKVSNALKKNKSVEYNDLKKCLESFPFNAKLATETVDAVLHFLSSYYVFFDRAKEDPPSGLTYQPVDLKNELSSLRKKQFNSDYDFSVLDDTVDSSNKDCEVIEIGGKPALQAIIDFANDTIQYSKDLNVRFNMALAPSQQSFPGQFFQQFTLREDLPKTSSIKYNLTCPKKGSVNFERKWNITFHHGFGGFSFNCLEQNNQTAFSLNDNSASSDKVTKLTSRDKITNSTLNNEPKIAHAQKLDGGSLYLLNDGSKTGVVVISEEKVTDENGLKNDFQKLKNNGTKKIILDMSNNPGGAITLSLFLTSLLFSSKQPNSFPTDIMINDFTIPKIEKNLKANSTDDNDVYNPNFFLSFPSGSPFNSSSEFIGTRKNRTSNLYLNTLMPNEKKLLENVSFPWTSDDIIIITNGFCASACALITLYLSEIHKVRTIAVGGLFDNQMSFSTYPGGQVTSPEEIAGFAGDNITDVPGINPLSLTIREAYSFDENNNIKDVLEYSFKPADCRIYYDEKNVVDSSLLWLEASKILNNEVKC
ncbi:peptidase s41 family protein [Gigaspora margarita]|uniref:Peptidase s41 family protein n=1 Tax=Gigaspora margarita TaxID=4874 RepID=A0A8H4EJ82_GIGMA|nr:peptidase s41 family protein [Gigaspora margarita]